MEKWVPHIWKEGARFHVISYHFTSNGLVMKCSEKNCEMNKPSENKADRPSIRPQYLAKRQPNKGGITP